MSSTVALKNGPFEGVGNCGNNTVEILARNLLDVNFKYTWKISKYLKHVDEGRNIDSPQFEVGVRHRIQSIDKTLFYNANDLKRDLVFSLLSV